ncbi:hypothetical protein PHLCEN_2v1112 [Hermanssonia centrifuga]|uniref:Uncharacterized protein n=1 Tax=Hermanssonia centrifuga TaxID=98765 RepID=A0A2R6S494_9APHY|nr:hypothetical protein PHLCEN_2v1112 [Hermanssonia centrifuga]
MVYDSSNPLTSAFQHSLSSTISDSRSSYPSSSPAEVVVQDPISPPSSVRGWAMTACPVQVSSAAHYRKSLVKTPGLTRTSAAEPVVSFAQAELKQSPNSGMISMVVKSSRGKKPRTRSPYPVLRGRKNSPLRYRVKVSDEDLAGTLEGDALSEKFGLDKFLPAALPKRKGSDENAQIDELLERGRTKSRFRGGRR